MKKFVFVLLAIAVLATVTVAAAQRVPLYCEETSIGVLCSDQPPVIPTEEIQPTKSPYPAPVDPPLPPYPGPVAPSMSDGRGNFFLRFISWFR